MNDRHADSGFTLIEMIITISVIVILATVAVPNYLGNKMLSNEGAAIGSMRTILSAQAAFQGAGAVDQDGDGLSEFGTLRELTGGVDLPGTGDRVRPPYLPRSVGNVDAQGRILKSGYYFQLYLPDATGLGIADITGSRALVDANTSELHWCIVAWPVRHGQTGRHAYFLNERGDLLKSDEAGYSGTANAPPAGCAIVGNTTPDHLIGTSVAANTVGSDGFRWDVVR
ncbi:MAG: type II secretion system protein [Planctomycetota bacterium]